MYERISIDPKVCHGQACIKGTRIPVHQIVRMLANGDTIEELLAEYPSLEREDILACLDYAAALAEEQAVQAEIREARAAYQAAVHLPPLERVEQLVAQLPPPEQLRLVARICEQLSIAATEGEAERMRQVRLQLAEELLAECNDIEDDSQGEFDVTQDIRQMREERVSQICQSSA